VKAPLSFLAFAFATLLAGAFAAEPKPTSQFTTTDPKKVKVLEDSARQKNPEADYFSHLCPGLGGYKVLHLGDDARSWINLQFDGKTTDLREATFAACRPGHMPSKANHVVEWRGIQKGKSFVPYAIIYRMGAVLDDDGKRTVDTLIIIKLDGAKSRVVGHVPAKEGTEKAEELADRLCR
jgi:hypothetical protein